MQTGMMVRMLSCALLATYIEVYPVTDDAEVCEVDASLALCEPRNVGDVATHLEECSREEGHAESPSQQ